MSVAEYIVTCRYCTQAIVVTNEYVHEDVKCPTCDKHLLVQPYMKAAKLEAAIEETPKELSDEERQAVAAVDSSLLELFDGATNKSGWEFALLATLMHRALAPLQAAVPDTPRPPKDYKTKLFRRAKPREFVEFINRKTDELFGMQDEFSVFLADDLHSVLYADDVVKVMEFHQRFSDGVARLLAHYQEMFQFGLPKDFPYPQLFEVIQGWVVHYRNVSNWVVSQLQGLYEADKITLSALDFQISLAPVSLQELFSLKMRLPQISFD